MLDDLFSQMSQGVLDLLGEDAFFNGATETVKINIEHGVQLTGIGGEDAQYKGDLVANRDVATIHGSVNPRAGHRFTFAPTAIARYAGKTYRLEFLVEDNGVSRRYVVTEVKP